MAADEQQLVRTITESVLAQVQAQITGMQEKITKLEQKVVAETNKRIQLEEEIRKLKEHPPYPAQKFFLRNYAMGEKGEEKGNHAGDTGI
jgi:cell division protein FtsB